MLRITRMVGDDSEEILKLEGKLQGPWVDVAHDAHAHSAGPDLPRPFRLNFRGWGGGSLAL